jgi:hypothetical protein
MKFNFKKVTALAASGLMIFMTAGFAAAANYPAPFVVGSTGDVAVVYGTGAGVSTLDLVESGNIQTNLQSHMSGTTSGTTTTASGGDSVLLERSSDKLNLGNSASTVFVTSIDSDDMATLLADGTYTDDDNTDYDYTQKIVLGSNLGIELFQDSDYDNLIDAAGKTPTIGIQLSDNEHVINYTLDFTTHPAYNASAMETTDLVLLGKTYYVLDVIGMGDGSSSVNKTTLLDSAASGIVTDGETMTIAGKSVGIEYISNTQVKLVVDGTTTNTLTNGGTSKLADGTYVGIKEILYDAKDAGISKVEVSIGTGKLELSNGAEIELNDVTIQEIKSFMVQDASYKLDKIVLQWTTDDEEFITPASDLLMPGFEAVKFTMADFVFPGAEVSSIEASGNDVIELKTVLEDGTVTIPILWANASGNIEGVGKDSSNRLVTSVTPIGTNARVLFFNQTAGDKYIVASWNSSTEAESYYLKVEMITEDSVNKVRFTNQITDSVKKVTNASDATFGSVSLTVNNVTRDGTKKWANISINTAGRFNELYTDGDMKVFLPYFITGGPTATLPEGALNYSGNVTTGTPYGVATVAPFVKQGHYNGTIQKTTGHGWVDYYQYFDEENKDSTLAAGNAFNVTIAESGTSNKIHVSAIGVNTGADSGNEELDSDNFVNYVTSDLATKTFYKTGGDQDSVDITYAGDQAYAELFIAAPDTIVTSGTVTSGTTQLGNVLWKDSEVSSVSSKNLIVIGGSCINSVAANLVGGAYCGSAWTESTSIGSGQFLIQSFGDAYTTGKIALLVAGYDASDTSKAVAYLSNVGVDTTAGNKYTGSTATSATLIVE